MKKILPLVCIAVAIQLFISLAGALIVMLLFPDTNVQAALPTLAIVGTYQVITTIVFLAFRWCHVSPAFIRTHPWSILIWTIVLSIGILIPLTWLEEFIPESWSIDLSGGALTDLLRIRDGWSFFQPGYVVICLLAPLMEEVVFRGAIISAVVSGGKDWLGAAAPGRDIRSASTKRKWLAIGISAVIFAVIHLNPAQIPHALIMGILLGWLYTSTGSILPGFLVHWVNNSASFVIINTMPFLSDDAKLIEIFSGDQTAVYKALVFSLLIAVPALYMVITLLKRHNQKL